MADPREPAIYRLPNELLLKIASLLRAPQSRAARLDLTSLSLVAKRLRQIAEDSLYRDLSHERLHIAPILRTLLSRPELALKVVSLGVLVLRKHASFGRASTTSFDYEALGDACLAKLEEMGYGSKHPWYKAVEARIGSALAGVLLTMLPRLRNLSMHILDVCFGSMPYTSDPAISLFGTENLPSPAVALFNSLTHLSIPAAHISMLTSDLQDLRSLVITDMIFDHMGRLQGPGTLPIGPRLTTLMLTIHLMAVAFTPAVVNGHFRLEYLIEALGCYSLETFHLTIFADGMVEWNVNSVYGLNSSIFSQICLVSMNRS
ncbi:hypothetical protein BDV96DRAFT_642916 [Lophiotrema nucula]|uniref:F-box domain-containing protein n=1 Tax=Lophiotrema nucula TaxID=690887 RepID=A0A6A5ZGU7_9PLEO|nr:hypothetical protein BDV96DRAFT_642916 [Lophiotrema nucula]